MTKTHDVVIAGGGPTGMMLAAELALAHVDVAIVERRATHELAGARAGGLHARTIEVLDQRGVAERFLAQGKVRAREVTDFAQDDGGVDIALSNGESMRAQYLVGCDGGRSVIRKRAGIDFAGWDPSVSYLIAEASMTEEPASGIRRDDRGVHALGKMDDGKRVRVVSVEQQVKRGDAPTLDDRNCTAIRGRSWRREENADGMSIRGCASVVRSDPRWSRSISGGTAMKFLFLYRKSQDPRDQPSPADMQAGYMQWKSWMAKYTKEILEQPPARSGPKPGGVAAVCRAGAVTDGPYVEGKEIVAGWSFIEAESLAHAKDIAKEVPMFTSVEILEITTF